MPTYRRKIHPKCEGAKVPIRILALCLTTSKVLKIKGWKYAYL